MRKTRAIPLETFRTQTPPHRPCEQEGCGEKGDFKAPKNPHSLRDYYWFCLDHVREYNKGWDFYRGMSSEEIEASRISDVTWNRPSWPVGAWRTLLETVQSFDGLDPFVKVLSSSPALPKEVQKALSTLETSLPLTPETLKKHYKQLVKCHHPDLHAGDKDAEERLKAINEAYQVIKKYVSK